MVSRLISLDELMTWSKSVGWRSIHLGHYDLSVEDILLAKGSFSIFNFSKFIPKADGKLVILISKF